MHAPLRYPPARRSDQVIRLHGVDVADPYAWLADQEQPEVRDWLSQQERLTTAFLAGCQRRSQFRDCLRKLPESSAARLPFRCGDRQFELRTGSQGDYRLVETTADSTRTLLDTARCPALAGYFLNREFVFMSPQARFAALGCTQAGEDWTQLFLLRLEDGIFLPGDWLPSAHLEVSWATDESGFYYNLTRSRFGKTERPDGVYWHSLASDGAPDSLTFKLGADCDAHCALPRLSRDGRSLYVKTLNFVTQAAALHIVDLAGGSQVRELLPYGSPLNIVGEHAGRVLVETRQAAPNGRIVSLDPCGATPDLREVAAEQAEPLELSHHTVDARFSTLAGDRVFATYVKDAAHRVRAYGLDGSSVGELAIPGAVTVLEVAARADRIEVAVTSFATPCACYRVDPATLATQSLVDRAAFVLPDLEVRQHFTRSRDGTCVPFFVIRRVGTSGPQPTLLYGYGGWGSSLTPSFRPDLAAWVDAGGCYAVANTRGGGEYGEHWHAAGARLNRHKTFEDFTACAVALIDERIAMAGALVTRGASNGALLVTAVLMRAPDLFGAVLAEVPLVDVVTLRSLPAGEAIAQEIGDATQDPTTFRYLLDYSPLQNVRPHPQRAALMLVPGGCDGRVPPAGAFKLTAAMQATAGPGQPTLLRLVPEGGHVGWSWTTQCDALADGLAFLWHFASNAETAACRAS